LHKSPFFKGQYTGNELPNSDRYTDTLVRLPLYYELENDQNVVIEAVNEFFK